MAEDVPKDDRPSRLTEAEFVDEFRSVYRVLWTIALAVLGGPSEADDAVQEAAIVALRRLDEFATGSNFQAWMASIVRHTAQNIARSTRRRDARNLTHMEDLRHRQPAPDAGSECESKCRVFWPDGSLAEVSDPDGQTVVAALHRLSEIQRATYLLRIAYDMSYRQIAVTLGIPESTARSNVYRARRTLLDEGTSFAKHSGQSPGRHNIEPDSLRVDETHPDRPASAQEDNGG